MYVDYNYYKNKYGGKAVSEESFKTYELKARLTLDGYTMKPKMTVELLDGVHSDRIKMTVCELIDNTKNSEELMEKAMQNQSMIATGLKSETVKDHSVSFQDKDPVTKVKEYINGLDMDIIYKYLVPTNLLYRGASVV